MARVTTYLNFPGNTEEAFTFYRDVFGTEFEGDINRMGDVPLMEGQPPLPENEQQLVMHVQLPILAGHVLMDTDSPDSMGMHLDFGNNISINLEPDTKEETDSLFAALSEGGNVTMPLAEMFWGAYFGALTDRFGVQWMFNCAL